MFQICQTFSKTVLKAARRASQSSNARNFVKCSKMARSGLQASFESTTEPAEKSPNSRQTLAHESVKIDQLSGPEVMQLLSGRRNMPQRKVPGAG